VTPSASQCVTAAPQRDTIRVAMRHRRAAM